MKGQKRIIFGLMITLSILQFWHAYYIQPRRIDVEEAKLVSILVNKGVYFSSQTPYMVFADFLKRMRAMWVDEQVFALLLFILALRWHFLERREQQK